MTLRHLSSLCKFPRFLGKLWSQTTKTFLRIANSSWKVLVHSHYCFTVHSLVEKDTKKTHQNVFDRNWKRYVKYDGLFLVISVERFDFPQSGLICVTICKMLKR